MDTSIDGPTRTRYSLDKNRVCLQHFHNAIFDENSKKYSVKILISWTE